MIRITISLRLSCADLDLGVEMPEDIVDLILEAAGEHLVSLVQHKLLDLVRPDTYKMMNEEIR